MVSTLTFPQSGDQDDAEHFAGMIAMSNIMDHVESGASLGVDYSVPEVTISDGTLFFMSGSQTASSSGETVRETGELVQIESRTRTLVDGAVNHVYAEPDIGTDDNGSYTTYTNQSNAPSSALKIGEVDTTNNSSVRFNRAPAITSRNPFEIIEHSDSNITMVELTGSGPLSLRTVNLDLGDNDISDVAQIDGGGDTVLFDDAIGGVGGLLSLGTSVDMNKNTIDGRDEIIQSGTRIDYGDLRR